MATVRVFCSRHKENIGVVGEPVVEQSRNIPNKFLVFGVLRKNLRSEGLRAT